MIALIAVCFLVLLALGVPVAFVIGVSGFVGLWWSGQYPLTVVVKQMFEGVDSFVLLAIPLFILAGSLMETGGIAVRLVRLAQVLVGWIRGGLSMAVVVAEYIFSGISGSTVADVSAIGSTMIPPMLRAGYRPEQAVAVVSAASAMGILVPPCILMIVIGSVANVSVAALFAAGFVPAVVIALAIMTYIWFDARRSGIEARAHATWAGLWHAFTDAVIPLGLPAIIFGGILGGVVDADRGRGARGGLRVHRGSLRVSRDRLEGPAEPPGAQRGGDRRGVLPAWDRGGRGVGAGRRADPAARS